MQDFIKPQLWVAINVTKTTRFFHFFNFEIKKPNSVKKKKKKKEEEEEESKHLRGTMFPFP